MSYCNQHMDDAPGIRGDCARHLRSGKRCEDCPNRSIHEEAKDLRADNERLRETLKKLCRDYVRLMEAGRDRITDLGGQCDPLDQMERDDPWLAEARAALGIVTHGDSIGTSVNPDQPNGATGWIDNAVTPPGESVERVLVAYPTGLVETTQAHYVRLYPTNYPWWMPLPVAPDPTPQPQPSASLTAQGDMGAAFGPADGSGKWAGGSASVVDTPNSPPLSSDNEQEKDDQIYSQAEEGERRSMSGSSGMDPASLSLLHPLGHAQSMGKMASKIPVPAGSEAAVHWYQPTPEI